MIFTSGTRASRAASSTSSAICAGQATQAEHWLGARPGDLVWCTAASGWSKSARNAFVAPWIARRRLPAPRRPLRPRRAAGAARGEQGVTVLCQSPTEYRMIAKRAVARWPGLPALRRLVSAGEPLNPEVIAAFETALGPDDPRRLRADRDRPADRHAGRASRCGPGSMGKPLPGFRLEVLDEDGGRPRRASSCLDPATVPTFFRGYLGERAVRGRALAHRRPRAPRRGRLPLVRGPPRRRDPLRRLPDRPVRGRVRARRAPRRRGGGRGRGARRRARRGRARGRRAARRLEPAATSSRASCRSTSSARPRPTSTRASSSSATSCRRPRAARSSAPSCAPSGSRDRAG